MPEHNEIERRWRDAEQAMRTEMKVEKLDVKLDKVLTTLELELRPVKEMLGQHDRALFGAEGASGLSQTIDRLDQAEARRTRTTVAAWAAFIGVVAAWCKTLIDWAAQKANP